MELPGVETCNNPWRVAETTLFSPAHYTLESNQSSKTPLLLFDFLWRFGETSMGDSERNSDVNNYISGSEHQKRRRCLLSSHHDPVRVTLSHQREHEEACCNRWRPLVRLSR